MDKYSIFIIILFVAIPFDSFYLRDRKKSVMDRVKQAIFSQLLVCVLLIKIAIKRVDRIERVDFVMSSLAISFMVLVFLVLFESQRLRIIEKRGKKG